MTSPELWTQIRVSFAGTLVEVAHLRPGQCFTLGEGPDADLTYATPGLHRLVIATESGAVLERLGCGELIALREGEWTCVELGAISVEIGCEPQLVPELGRRPVELGWWLSLASAALIVIPFLALALRAAEFVAPPLETDAAPYLAYTVRSRPAVEQPRDELRPPPREAPRTRDQAKQRRSSKPRETPAQADPSNTPSLARSPGAPRDLAPALRRDGDPVAAARSGGVLGAMPDEEEIEEFVSVAAASFSPDVDDHEMWAAMAGGPIDTTIGGLELVGSGRSGGEASEIVRAGAPVRPQPDRSPALAKDQARTLRARVLGARIDGELGSREALAFANSLRDEWLACLDDEGPVEFEVRYTVARDGKIGGAEVPRRQLSARARRCIAAATEGRAGFGPTGDGKLAAVVHTVEVR